MAAVPTFTDKSIKAIVEKKSILCVGLDPQARYMPPHLIELMRQEYGVYTEIMAKVYQAFNKAIIDSVHDVAVWVKPQSAFYEVLGSEGIRALEETTAYAHSKGLIVILDAKRGDGSDTAEAYANTYLGLTDEWPNEDGVVMQKQSPLRMDALTIHGYIGTDCVGRFANVIKANGTCAFVVDKTSFRPNSELEQTLSHRGLPVWRELANLVSRWGEGTEGEKGWRNLGVVMGATFPEDTVVMRLILPKAWFLVPGYGAQGGGADDAVIGADADGFGITVNSSRGITFAYNNEKDRRFNGPSEKFAECARLAAIDARDQLNAALQRAGKGKAFLKAA